MSKIICFAVIALSLCVFSFAIPVSSENSTINSNSKYERRLYEYIDKSQTVVRKWMALPEILEEVAECGKAGTGKAQIHGGFMDITDHQNATIVPSLIGDIPTSIRNEALVNRIIGAVNIENVRKTIQDLSAFNTRYYRSDTGVDAAKYIYDKFQQYITESGSTGATVEYFAHSWVQPSVIATIPGEIADLVIIGAHEDSIRSGMFPSLTAPGADDDASGSASVLEIFRALITDPTFRPRKTIQFHTYSGEEAGLLGSQDIANAYQKKNYVISGMLQMDMTAYKNGDPAIVTDYVNTPLTNFVFSLASKFTTANWVPTTCGYACSDHASWNKLGYAAVFPFEAIMSKTNPRIHTINDVIDILDMPHALHFVNLAAAFAVEMTA